MFSKRLKELRSRMGVTQDELSKHLGVQRAAISKYESGKISPSLEILEGVAQYFDTTVDYLLGRSDDPENSDRFGLEAPEHVEELFSVSENTPSEGSISPEIMGIARGLQELEPDNLQLFKDLLKSLRKAGVDARNGSDT